MPAIVSTPAAKGVPRVATRTVLGASGNTITYNPGTGQTLLLLNTTAGALTPLLIGAGATTADLEGAGTINFAAGLSLVAIAATTGSLLVSLDMHAQYLKGVIDITGGTGLVAILLTP